MNTPTRNSPAATVNVPTLELIESGSRTSSADRIAINSHLNQQVCLIQRDDARLDECVELLLEGWDSTPSEYGLPESATDEEIDAARRPLIRDWLWAHLCEQIGSMMDDLKWHSDRFADFSGHDVQTVRELRAKYQPSVEGSHE